ncbi:Uncharacterised protein [Mycobacteroides abscessus subsp. abscessus]|uniref:hypothetical protein n=1 Tax=Mycobacteroides abscessus TaxID=36809 RepID=UPI00092C6A32|nr:hypothetical protein [Mycobacteroides abscessus]SHS10676.1 Uncharacterised protein [Mycobacteroides abscessus subsp. abscessus]SHS83884.1 Uncharacterised protein [Mycobacteroides abscessus subsp. abscessus]
MPALVCGDKGSGDGCSGQPVIFGGYRELLVENPCHLLDLVAARIEGQVFVVLLKDRIREQALEPWCLRGFRATLLHVAPSRSMCLLRTFEEPSVSGVSSFFLSSLYADLSHSDS